MNNNQLKCVVVIPVYKVALNETEASSFKQALRILQNYTVVLLTHKSLNLTEYFAIAEQQKKTILVELFPKHFFRNISGYNNLMMSRLLYFRFKEYTHMLVYQLDAWVFSDKLSEWILKEYDYVGAPSFDHLDHFEPQKAWIGNGGFSLRRIKTFYEQYNGLSWYQKYIRTCLLHKNNAVKRFIETGFLIIQAFLLKNNLCFGFQRTKHEDLFWTHLNTLKIPEYSEAIQFSFEKFPGMLFEQNDRKLPFGCHAWEKFELESFWKNYIP